MKEYKSERRSLSPNLHEALMSCRLCKNAEGALAPLFVIGREDREDDAINVRQPKPGSGLRFCDSQSVEGPPLFSSRIEQILNLHAFFNLQSAMLMTPPRSLLLTPPPSTQ